MNCKEFENKIIQIIENTASETDKIEAVEHIRTCNDCARKYDFFKNTFDLIEKEKNEKVNPFIETRILSKIEIKSKNSNVYNRIIRPVLIAATLIIGIFLGNFISNTYLSYKNSNLQAQYQIDTTEQLVISEISNEDYYFVNNQ